MLRLGFLCETVSVPAVSQIKFYCYKLPIFDENIVLEHRFRSIV